MHRTPVRMLLSIALLGAGLAAMAGCNLIMPVYAIAVGPGEVEGVYELDPSKKTVILIDDPASKIALRRTRIQIGESAQQMLMRKNKVREGNMIDTRSAIAVATNGDRNLSVTEIGEAVGAEVIIYVIVTRFGIAADDGVDFDPSSELEVKVFDVTTHSRLWPPAGEPGYRSRFSGKRSGNRYLPDNRTDQLRAQVELARITGEGLSQLFYDVETPQSLRR